VKRDLVLEAQGLTFDQLFSNTQRVLGSAMYKASPTNFGFENVKKNEFAKFKYVSYDAQVFSRESNKHYNTSIFFYNIDTSKDELPDLHKSVARVSCSCAAYYFYFSYWNKVHGVHARRPLRPYVRKTPPPPEGLPERNPMHLAGCCKHIAALANYLAGHEYFIDAPVKKAYTPFNSDPGEKDRAFNQDDASDADKQDN